jgi:hypothetical protein
MRRSLKSRRGVTAVLAMMYLMLFSTLALGFFATMTSSGQLSGNDQRSTEARLAAESGMHFMKYHLKDMRVPKEARRSTILAATYDQLSARLDGTPNMKGETVGVSADGTKVFVPGPEDAYISVDGSGMEFRATIERYGEWGLRVTCVGRANPASTAGTDVRGGRGVQLEFDNVPVETPIFEYGVASRGPVTMDSNATISGLNADLGSMLITSTVKPALTMRSMSSISGEVGFLDPIGAVLPQPNTTISGDKPTDLSYTSNLNTVAAPPEFPAIDTEPYRMFVGDGSGYHGVTITPPNSAGNTLVSGAARNILIKASPHVDRWVVIDGSQTISGIIYIETPNKVRIDSNVVIRGAIVVQNDPTHDHTRNQLVINSNVTLKPIESLAALADPDFPETMTRLSGASILAPKFNLTLNSNFGVEGGSIIADKITMDSNATGAIDGSVITLSDQPLLMNGNSHIQIKSIPTAVPIGLRFTSHYKPLPGSYKEVKP